MKVLVGEADSVTIPGMKIGMAIPLGEPYPQENLDLATRLLVRAIFNADPLVSPGEINFWVEKRKRA